MTSGTRNPNAPEPAIVLDERLDGETAGKNWKPWHDLIGAQESEFVIDASRLKYCDGSGMALLASLQRAAEEAGRTYRLDGLSDELEKLLATFSPGSIDISKIDLTPRQRPWLEQIGETSVGIAKDFRQQVEFTGELTVAVFRILRNPRKLRWKDTLVLFEKTGVNALPIVGMIAFLMGFIMAFQSSIPLKTFGVDIFVVNLVALAVLRELGALMTAILLAGRSGSAFAAEIGTMKVNEEINALHTMGIDPVVFLAMPRIIATIAVTPLLTIYADFIGITGGFAVMMMMGFPGPTLWTQMLSAVDVSDIMVGFIKSFAFGFLVAAIGCLRGLQTRAGATAVGDSTTRSVVSGIFLIIVADAIFSIVFFYTNL